jgi:signal transduction histidine kinase
MRWRLALGAAAVTLTMMAAFLVPLAAAVRLLAAERATDAATLESQSLAGVLATVEDRPTVQRVVDEVGARSRNQLSVFLPSGEIVGNQAPGGPSLELARKGQAFTAAVAPGRAVFVPVRGPTGRVTVIRVGIPSAVLREGVSRTWLQLGLLAVALVLLAVILADRLARSIVRPMHELSDVAGRLQHGELEVRVTPSGPPEVATVGAALNGLADRIDDLLATERESMADVSHQLRTPLTVLRLDIEALEASEERDRVQHDVDLLEDAVGRVITEAREPRRRTGAITDLAAAVRLRQPFWETMAGNQQRPCSVSVPENAVPVPLSAAEATAAIDALVNNVFTHTAPGTGFRVVVEHPGGRGRIVVEDDGPGWPAGFKPRRGSSGAGSTGLGLDIARRTAERAGGSFRTARSATGGARVELEFGPA